MKLALRVTFAVLFFTVLLSTALATTERRDKITWNQCLYD